MVLAVIHDCTRCVLVRYFDMANAKYVLRPVPMWQVNAFPFKGSSRWEETRQGVGGDQVNVIMQSQPVIDSQRWMLHRRVEVSATQWESTEAAM